MFPASVMSALPSRNDMQFGENLVFFCFFSVFLIFVYLFFFFALKAISLFWRSLYHSPSPRAEVPSDDHLYTKKRTGLRSRQLWI
uniref:Uncharacterized protein n=1 Tax=Peromyscus maniculatus bairdii TaxID=230844 RepID=A0A8C9CT01_PERMB